MSRFSTLTVSELPAALSSADPTPGGGTASAIAGAMGVSLPNTATTQELMNSCTANGGAKWDHSALVKALERVENHEVAK